MRRLGPLAALAAILAAAAPAAAAPAPSAALKIAFTMPSGPTSVWGRSAGNCLILTGGWSRASTPRFEGLTTRPRGLLDVGGRAGEAIVPGEAIHVDRIFGARPRAAAARDVGIQLAGRRAYLTGTIGASRSYSARSARRQRLAALHGVALSQRTVRGGLVVTVRGRATMLAPLAGMLERLRCRGPRVDEHPIPVGAPLGTVTATIVPARATAQVERVGFAVELGGSAPEPPQAVPTGGAQADGDGLTFAAAGAARIALACTDGGCEPSDGSVPLFGGFDVVDGARRLSVTDLTLELADGRPTLTGSVAGARIEVAHDVNRLLTISDGLRAQLAATFADPDLGGYLPRLRLPLGALAPA